MRVCVCVYIYILVTAEETWAPADAQLSGPKPEPLPETLAKSARVGIVSSLHVCVCVVRHVTREEGSENITKKKENSNYETQRNARGAATQKKKKQK